MADELINHDGPATEPTDAKAPGPHDRDWTPRDAHDEASDQGGHDQHEDGQDRQSTQLTTPGFVPPEHQAELEEYVRDVGVLAHDAGLNRDEAQRLVDYTTDLAIADPSGVDITNSAACRNVLRSRYGDEANKIIEAAQRTVTRLGPKVAEYLDRTSLGNSPAVLVALAEFERGGTRMSPEKAKAELDKIMSDKSNPYWKETARNHHATVDRVRLLSAMAYPSDEADDAKSKTVSTKSGTPTAMETLDREIKRAQADPAYLNPDAPTHKAAVMRVDELYRRRYPE